MKDAHPEIEETSDFFYPMAEAQITEGSTFAVVLHLASCEFPVSNKGCTWTHPYFPKLNVVIPKGAVPQHKKVNVIAKVNGKYILEKKHELPKGMVGVCH